MVNKLTFDLYKSYLVKVAEKEGRPFRLPKTTKTLEERTDCSFFIVLGKKLKEKDISSRKQMDKFMDVACNALESFHVTDLVDSFETLYESYKNVKEDTKVEIEKKIKVAFDNLIDYCIINSVKDEQELLKGSPPTILKLWKTGKLDERILVSMFDLRKIKNKPWFRAYCGDLASRFIKLEKNINSNVHLSSFIEGELVRFKTIFK
jgi:hypothetical protein